MLFFNGISILVVILPLIYCDIILFRSSIPASFLSSFLPYFLLSPLHFLSCFYSLCHHFFFQSCKLFSSLIFMIYLANCFTYFVFNIFLTFLLPKFLSHFVFSFLISPLATILWHIFHNFHHTCLSSFFIFSFPVSPFIFLFFSLPRFFAAVFRTASPLLLVITLSRSLSSLRRILIIFLITQTFIYFCYYHQY